MKPKRPDPLFEVGEVVRFRLPHSELMLVNSFWWNKKQQMWEYECRIPMATYGSRYHAVEPLLQVVDNPEAYCSNEDEYNLRKRMGEAATKGGL